MISSILTAFKGGGQLPLATWLWAFAALLVIGAVAYPVYNIYFHPLRHVPGPKSLAATRIPYTRIIASGQTHKEFQKLHEIYGHVVRVSPDEVSVIGESAWDDLMGHRKNGAAENGKDPGFFALSKHSVIGANREDHSRLRKTLSHGFSEKSIESQESIVGGYIDELVQQLKNHADGGKPALDLVAWYNWTTFDIIGDLTLGRSFDGVKNGEYHVLVELMFGKLKGLCIAAVAFRWGILAPVIARVLGTKAIKTSMIHRQLVADRLKERAKVTTERPDYYQAMTAPTDERKQKFSPMEVFGTSNILLTAGSETTATTLSGATYLLTQNPKVLAKLTKEVRSAFTDESEITMKSVKRLSYMLAVLDEALRMYPPVPVALPRQMNPDGGRVCGYFIPGGTTIGICQWAAYYNSEFFHDAEIFVPERWQGDEKYAGDCKKVFQPFSWGPRNCLGKNLAYAEMRLILARVIWNFDLRLDAESENWLEDSEVFSLWNKPPLKVHLTPVAH